VDLRIIYFGNDWFAENRTSSHHVARRLARQFPLLYVASPGMRAPQMTGRDLRKLFHRLGQVLEQPRQVEKNLWVCTVPQIPFRNLPAVAWLNRRFGRWAIRRAMRALPFERSISWFVLPHPGFLAGQLGEEYIVYYCIDDYAAHPHMDREEIQRMDEELTRRADQVFVASPRLLERKRAAAPTATFSPHGVDAEMFRRVSDPATQVAAGAANLRHPVIGFFGVLGEWIDMDLLEYLGSMHPDWTFLIVGRVAADVSQLRKLGNFVFPGPQPYQSLPGWAKAFDVAIIPYQIGNEQILNANPLKLREYLATGKPVVSVPTPEVDRFAHCVRIGATKEEFLNQVEQALAGDTVEQRQARWEAVKDQSWEARVQEVWQVVEQGLHRKKGKVQGT
jgi:glycosyltransferase involved in cell wall biosynthesis